LRETPNQFTEISVQNNADSEQELGDSLGLISEKEADISLVYQNIKESNFDTGGDHNDIPYQLII